MTTTGRDESRAASPPQTFRERTIEEIERVNWVPDWGKNRMEAAVKAGRTGASRVSAPGACPSLRSTTRRATPFSMRIVRNAAESDREHGSNVWFESTAAELWAALKPADWKGAEAATKSNDTLDVWIDSGSSSRAVIAQRPELRGRDKPFQCDMYLEGSDQHRGWFQSSLLLSLAGNGAAPFKTVLTHGFMVDDGPRQRFPRASKGQAAMKSRKRPRPT